MSQHPDTQATLMLMAEETLAAVRERALDHGFRGVDVEAAALTILQHAFAMAVAEGANGNLAQAAENAVLAGRMLASNVGTYHATLIARRRARAWS